MRSDRRPLAFGLAALLAVGCGDYFIMASDSVDGGGGDDDDNISGEGEGGATMRDGSVTPGIDGQTPVDGDATATTSFCKAAASIFCDDFDDGAAFGAHWDSTPTHGQLIDTTFASSPRSYRLTFPDQSGDGVDYLAKSVSVPTGKNLRIELAFRVEANAELYPLAVFFPGDKRLMLNLDGFVNEANGSNQNAGYPYTRPAADGNWHRYTFNIERGNTVELLVDGNVALAKRALTNPGVLTDAPFKLAVGLYYAPPHTPWTGGFDDVRVSAY